MQSLKKLLNIGNLYAFFYVYGCFKHSPVLGKYSAFLLLPLAILATLFLYLVLILSAIYYEIVDFVLRLRHGDDYFGIMDGSDLIWVVEEGSASLINSLFMIDAKDGEGYGPLYEFMKSSYQRIAETHAKMSCVRKYSMGYGYFLRTKLKIEDHVKYLDGYEDVEGLNMLMDKLSDSPLPEGNTALWEVYVGKIPIKWARNGGKLQYPIFIKYHHSLGDGISIITLMTTQLIDNGLNIMKEKCKTYRDVIKKAALKNAKPSFLENLKKIFSKSYYITYYGPLDDGDENLLHGKPLSHDKHVCYFMESDSTNYVEKVKAIKNRIDGITFSDVIMAAFSASCSEYYMTHDKIPPEKIRLVMPHYIASSDFEKIATLTPDGESIANLKNNFALGFLNFHIKDTDIANNIMQRLQRVHETTVVSKESLDFPFVFWQIKVISTLVPLSILEKSVKMNRCTVGLTNVPGNTTANLGSGHRIRDTLVWAPNYLTCGITFTIFTYDGLFRFGLLVDKVIIENKPEVQAICNNVFKYIDLLDAASKQPIKSN